MDKKIVLGLTGTNAAGKGELAKYLVRKGFSYFSLSDELRKMAKKRGIKPTRENLIVFGNNLRKKQGPGILAKRIIPKLKQKSVVDSIRNIYEIKELRKVPEFKLIGIDAPVKLRFQRAKKRGRVGDGASLKDFILKEKKEKTSNRTSQQLHICLKNADIKLMNNSTLAELHKKIGKILLKSNE